MDDDFCAYPNCERHTDLEQCKHCKNYFCYKHVAPMQLNNYQSHLFRKERKELDDKSHRCRGYIEQLEKERKPEKDKKAGKSIDENLIKEIYETVKRKRYHAKFLEKAKKPLKYAFFAVVSILILALLIYTIPHRKNPDVQESIVIQKIRTVNRTVTIYETVELKSSFDDYLKNKDKYDSTVINLTGFLRYKLEGTGNSGIFKEVIVDDFGKEIDLVNIPNLYRKYFVKRETTKELYNVTGTFKRTFKGANIDVDKIIFTERPLTILERKTTMLINVTE